MKGEEVQSIPKPPPPFERFQALRSVKGEVLVTVLGLIDAMILKQNVEQIFEPIE